MPYLLQEDGSSKFVLENGTGDILLENAVLDGNDESWCAAVQLCFSRIGLAALLAISFCTSLAAANVATAHNDEAESPIAIQTDGQLTVVVSNSAIQLKYNYSGDDLPTPPPFVADEDYWINTVQPLMQQMLQSLPYFFDEGLMSFVTPEEDYQPSIFLSAYVPNIVPALWVDGAANDLPPPALETNEDQFVTPQPIQATFNWPQQFSFDQPEYVFTPDEDFWSNTTTPVAANTWPQQWSYEQNDQTFLYTDEDYWQILGPYVPGANRVQAFSDTDDLPLQFALDEDYWQLLGPHVPIINPVAPFLDTEDFTTQFDEDFWQVSLPIAPPAAPTVFTFNDDLPVQVTVGDEDYWQIQGPPVQAANIWPQQFVFEQNEFAAPIGIQTDGLQVVISSQWPPIVVCYKFAGDELSFVVTLDEDFVLLPLPAQAPTVLVQPFTFDTPEYVFQPDEDAQPISVVQPQLHVLQPIALEDDLPTLATIEADEETLPAQPAQQTNFLLQPFVFDQPEYVFTPEEDLWLSGIAPQQLVEAWPQQWSFDQQDYVFTPEEDFWAIALPIQAQAIWPQQFNFEQHEVPSLATDEDLWQVLLPYVQQKPPLVFSDTDEITSVGVDELYWQNPVAPIAASLTWPQQWSFDTQEPGLYGQPDEDFWQNPVAPLAAANTWLQQWPFATEETIAANPEEDFWQNTVAPAPAAFVLLQPFTLEQHEYVFTPDEDVQLLALPQQQQRVVQPFAVEDDLPTLAEIEADEEQAPVLPLQTPQVFVLQPFSFDTPEYVFQPDEDAPPALVIQLQQRVTQPTAVEDDLPTLAEIEADEEIAPPQAQPVTPSFLLQPFSFDTPDYVFNPDEDFWFNPTAPIAGTLNWPQQFPFDVQEPAGNLSGQPDEDYWQNPTWPVAATLNWPQQFNFDPTDNVPQTFANPEEDFWQNPVAPIPATLAWLQQWPFDVQEPAGHLYGATEEDFWQNAVAPVTWLNLYPQQFAFEQHEFVAQFDEDFVQLAIPATQPQRFTQQFSFDTPEYVFQPDEDVQPIALPQLPARVVQPIALEDDLPTLAEIESDEDVAPALPPQPAAGFLLQPFAFDQPEYVFTPDEDFWAGAVNTIPALRPVVPYLPDTEETAPTQHVVEEELWLTPQTQPYIQVYPQQFGFDQPETITPVISVDEDFWQNQVAPVAATLTYPQPFNFDQPERPAQFDEDYWQNAVTPQPLVEAWPQQFTFDTAETIPKYDEDYCQNQVAPRQLVEAYPQPFGFDQPDLPLSFMGEDFWQNPTPAVAARLYQQLPYQFDRSADDIVFPLGPEEDFWANPTPPIAASMYLRLPYLPDPEEVWSPIPPAMVMAITEAQGYGEVTVFKISGSGQFAVASIGEGSVQVSAFKISGGGQVIATSIIGRIAEASDFKIRGLKS